MSACASIPVAGPDAAAVRRAPRSSGGSPTPACACSTSRCSALRRKPTSRDFEPALATAQRLGASELLVHGADPDEARLVENFGRLCDLAARYRLRGQPRADALGRGFQRGEERSGSSIRRRGRTPRCWSTRFIFSVPRTASARFRKSLNYMQLCDARAERPADMQEIIRQARADRLFPGEGGLDLQGLMRALPRGPSDQRRDPVCQADAAARAGAARACGHPDSCSECVLRS